jgi:hypothetical protein
MSDQVEAIIRLRRGPDSERRLITFDRGEIVFSSDISHLFIGDGETTGGKLVGNLNYINGNRTPSPSGIYGDLYFDDANTILYILSSNAGPDNIQNYARITPDVDPSLVFVNGKYGINPSYFKDSGLGYVRLSGDLMFGFLTLHAHPTAAMHAATKWSVDQGLSGLKNDIGNNFVRLSGDTMTGPLTINSGLSVLSAANFKGDVELNNKLLQHFSVKVTNSTMLNASNSYQYNLTQNDNGCVVCVDASDAGYIGLPSGLPVGFNALIVNLSNFSISFISSVPGGVTIGNVYDYRTIGKKYGVCNLVYIDSSRILISGDLS